MSVPSPESRIHRHFSSSRRIVRRSALVVLCGLLGLGASACSVQTEGETSDAEASTVRQGLSKEERNDLATAFYALGNLITVDITMDPDTWTELRTESPRGGHCMFYNEGSRFDWHAATDVKITGSNFPEVSSSMVEVKKKSWCGSFDNEKPSLKIKFADDAGVQDQIGTRRLTLNNSKQDSTFLRQCVGYRLFEAAGLPAARCNFARVRVNGEDVDNGLYVNVEPVEKLFMDNNFNSNREGNLYELDFSDLTPEHIEVPPGVMAGEISFEGFSAFEDKQDLSLAIDGIGQGNLASVIDVDQFISYWAMEILLRHWDGLTSGSNNTYIYNDVTAVENPSVENGDVRFKFIASGIDRILVPGQKLRIYQGSVLAKKALEDNVLEERLRRRIYQYLGQLFSAKELKTSLLTLLFSTQAHASVVVSGVVPPAAGKEIYDVLRATRKDADEAFKVVAPTATVTLKGLNDQCAHRGHSLVDTDAWSLDYRPCSEATGESFWFNLEPSASMPGYYKLSYADYVVRADNTHAAGRQLPDVYYGRAGDDSDYAQYFALIPRGNEAEPLYAIQSLETGRCLYFHHYQTTGEGNYQIVQSDCDGAPQPERTLITFGATGE